MKVASILLMLLTVLMMVGFGMFYLLGFAMSFDAPGSTTDPKAWGMRLLFFAPFFIFLVVLILSWQAYAAGNYRKSVLLGVVSPAICVGLYLWMMVTSMSSMKQYNNQVAEEKEIEARYPKEEYIRQTSLGTDSIIVWPTGQTKPHGFTHRSGRWRAEIRLPLPWPETVSLLREKQIRIEAVPLA